MTHGQNFMREMAEAYQALEREPEHLREIEALQAISQRDGDIIARLELKLMDRASQIDELQAKLSSVEAELYDAGFRQLEAEDKLGALRRAVEGAFPALGQALAVTSGDDRSEVRRFSQKELDELYELKATKEAAEVAEAWEEVKRAKEEAARYIDASSPLRLVAQPSTGPVEHAEVSGESVPDPTVEKTDTSWPSASSSTAEPPGDASSASSEGVSVSSDPIFDTSMTTASPQTSPSETVPDDTANPPDGAQTQCIGKYSGKVYKSWPAYVSEADWLEGGGTIDSYWEGRERLRF